MLKITVTPLVRVLSFAAMTVLLGCTSTDLTLALQGYENGIRKEVAASQVLVRIAQASDEREFVHAVRSDPSLYQKGFEVDPSCDGPIAEVVVNPSACVFKPEDAPVPEIRLWNGNVNDRTNDLLAEYAHNFLEIYGATSASSLNSSLRDATYAARGIVAASYVKPISDASDQQAKELAEKERSIALLKVDGISGMVMTIFNVITQRKRNDAIGDATKPSALGKATTDTTEICDHGRHAIGCLGDLYRQLVVNGLCQAALGQEVVAQRLKVRINDLYWGKKVTADADLYVDELFDAYTSAYRTSLAARYLTTKISPIDVSPEPCGDSIAVQWVKSLTPVQVNALPDKVVRGLTSDQIKALSNSQLAAIKYASLTQGQFRELTLEQLQVVPTAGIKPEQQRIQQARLATSKKLLTFSHIQLATPAEVSGLEPLQIRGLTTDELKSLDRVQMNALTQSQIKAMTVAQVRGLSIDQLKQMTVAQVSALSREQVGGLSREQADALEPALKMVLPPLHLDWQHVTWCLHELARVNGAKKQTDSQQCVNQFSASADQLFSAVMSIESGIRQTQALLTRLRNAETQTVATPAAK